MLELLKTIEKPNITMVAAMFATAATIIGCSVLSSMVMVMAMPRAIKYIGKQINKEPDLKEYELFVIFMPGSGVILADNNNTDNNKCDY